MAGNNGVQTTNAVSHRNVKWILANVPAAQGFFTPTVNSLLGSLRAELTALGPISPASDSYLLTPSHLARDPSTFPEKMVEHVLTTPKQPGFDADPVWMMMTQHVRTQIGNPTDVLPDPSGPPYAEGRAAIAKWITAAPSYSRLVAELMTRSQALMAGYVRQFHGSHLTLYRTLVVGQGLKNPIRHSPLSAWADDKKFAEAWKNGPRLLLTASVPADCVWIAPGWAEAELVISPHSPAGNRIKIISTTELDPASPKRPAAKLWHGLFGRK